MPRPLRWRAHLVAGFMTVLAAAAGAAQAPLGTWAQGKEPLQVDAQSLEVRGEEARVVFSGQVRARQGDLTLEADRLEVTLDPETRELRSAYAEGNVRIRRGDVLATGRTARYDAARGVVVLEGDPKVWRGKNLVAGDRITLFLAEDRSVVEGARAVIYPQGEER
ncbi:lipopolysaccharide transport periplasmic protein LptA [Deferrisoma camini]|uniref:lipopolysaccharide transport periplasmic protein LptA n=1 Tax=Deferrisoma camini TaxID=1035120 RepID=UPI00146AA7B1|nr:lipopolysaccharide transport periplasmic protein LptA [Deferrisoma camini]